MAGKQASSANLTAFAGLTGASNKLAYFTGASALALADISAFGRSLIDDADGGAARTTLGLGTAATLNHGTAAGNLVRLDPSTGKLPAVDGSALTNLPGGGGLVLISVTNMAGATYIGLTLSNTYDDYVVEFTDIAYSGGVNNIYGSFVFGITEVLTPMVWSRSVRSSASTSPTNTVSSGGGYFHLCTTSGTLAATTSGKLEVNGARSIGTYKTVKATFRHTDLTNLQTFDFDGAHNAASNAIDIIRITSGGGAFAGGYARLFGKKKI